MSRLMSFPGLPDEPPPLATVVDDLAAAVAEIEARTDLGPAVEQGGDEFKMWCPLHQPPEHRKGRPDLMVKVKDSGGLFFRCSGQCSSRPWEDLRAALLSVGVPESYLGPGGGGNVRNGSTAALRPSKDGFRAHDGKPETEGVYAAGEQTLVKLRENLHRDDTAMAYLTTERGWDEGFIVMAQIGLRVQPASYVVPILDEVGDVALNLVHLHRHQKGFSQAKGFGSPTRLWGIHDLPEGPVLWCSGFWDAGLARSLGFAAVTATQGEGSLPRRQDVDALRGRDIVLVPDLDAAGRAAEERLLRALRDWAGARSVRVLHLPGLDGTAKRKDLTDWWRTVRDAGAFTNPAEQLAQLVAGARAAGDRERFRLLGPAEWAQPMPPMEWDVRGVWPRGSFGPLAGEKKTLKTYTAMAVGLALASGQPAFGHEDFRVPSVRPVLYFNGEGGQRAASSRLRRLAAAYGIYDPADVPFFLVCDAGPLDGPDFLDALRRAVDTVQPGLVVLDPLYAFHPSGIEAQNLYERGRMLSDLSKETVEHGVSLIVPDHFRKTGSQALDLDSIAQSGMAAWADSWALQAHRGTPSPVDVANGHFRLTVEFGSREGYGRRWDLDWSLGAFDADTGEHGGGITWTVAAHDHEAAAERTTDRIVAQIVAYVEEHPEGVTQTDVFNAKDAEGQAYVRGRNDAKRRAWDECVAAGRFVDAETGRSARKGKRVVPGPGKHRLRTRPDSGRNPTSTPEPDQSAPAEGGRGRKPR